MQNSRLYLWRSSHEHCWNSRRGRGEIFRRQSRIPLARGAQGRHAADQIALAQAQAVALSQAADRLREARGRGDEIADRFEGKLDNIKIENKTFNNETRVETEKLVYTDCKLPDTGADLLKRHVDSVNARLLGSSTTTTPAKK
jgi:hypothetical protein